LNWWHGNDGVNWENAVEVFVPLHRD